MICPKKLLPVFLTSSLLTLGLILLVKPVFASSSYYDFGPYYGRPQVLGLSFSNLENLPVPDIPESLIPKGGGTLPGSFFYPFERIGENLQLTITFDPVRKEEMRLRFAEERLAEAKTLMDQGKEEQASQAISDFKDTLSSSVQTPAASSLANKLEEVATQALVVAETLSLSSNPLQAENWSRAREAAIDVLDKVADVKGEASIPEELSQNIQKLKEEGLISEEESNKLYGFETRSQVRDELDKLVSSGQFPAAAEAGLNTAVAQRFPEVYQTMQSNLQVAELRSYQTLPQPNKEDLALLEKWQENPSIPPSNEIKPYLWYSRAQDLAENVDLSGFSAEQQSEVAKSYPLFVNNPTYSPPPTVVEPSSTPEPSVQPSPIPTSSPADSYLGQNVGALPGQPLYFFKRLQENAGITFTFDPVQKARLLSEFAERRLSEAKQLSNDPKKASLYEEALKSYSQTFNDASNALKNAKDSTKTGDQARQLETQAARHEAIFEKGLLPAPPKNPEIISAVIKTAEDAMDRSADILERPALPPALSSRLEDLKAQGLILPEETDGLVGSATREEVRSKVRKLLELKTFPLADAKKLDEAQSFSSQSDYNQLVEVRKVEELQDLRTTQTQLAQTPTLKANADSLSAREQTLTATIDTLVIKKEDLTGRDDMIKVYEKLSSLPRPINGGQFGNTEAAGTEPQEPPARQDAVLTTCPEGAIFKQSEGCVWADSRRSLNDYEQYKCEGPRQYYSFAAKKCIAYEGNTGFRDDAQPICPVGYSWNWQTQSCQKSTDGTLPFPSPSGQPAPEDCPQNSTYKEGQGCVWDENGKSVYDPAQYRCQRPSQYYSFVEQKCVASPKEGEVYPKDASPSCKEENTYWSWSSGKCLPMETPLTQTQGATLDDIKPSFVTPDSPFYFLKQWGENVQTFVAFTPEAKSSVRLAQARERLAESYDALQKGKDDEAGKALGSYTTRMQEMFNDLSKSSLSEEAKKKVSERLSQQAVEQNLILQKIEVIATDDQTSAISAASSATILGVDKAAEIAGENAIPQEVKQKIESLPQEMISEEDKKALLETDSRVEARVKLGTLTAVGGLTAVDTAYLNGAFEAVPTDDQIKLTELKKLEEIATIAGKKDKIGKEIEKNEEISTKLAEFQKTFEPGKEVPSEIRAYVRLTRINEVAQTVRPDIVRLDDFQNRKDVLLAVATLQEEFKPTRESFRQVEDFRRRNPGVLLPVELARIEALSFSLGVRNQAEGCYLPTPPFPPNTPCPAPGAAIPISSYTNYTPPSSSGYSYPTPGIDKDGKPLVYGQGPKAEKAGTCPSGYHWMYDSGGWCMSDSGGYTQSYSSYTPSGTGAGYTPYSPYYTAPGAPPATFGYPGSNTSYPYNPPSYYGPAPTYYTTNPPAGTVPGSGPRPSAPGQCPSGFHWMSDSGGWCMADGQTYVPGGSSYPAGGTYYSPNLTQSSCGPGYYWDGRGCIRTSPTDTSYSSPGSYQYGCTPGYYWNGSKCTAGSNEGSGWSDTAARSQSWCQPPSGGCGSNSYWDYGSCYCRSSSTYYGGTGSSPSNQCQGLSCGGGAWLDYSTCSCKYSGGSGTSSTGSTITCYPPSAGCPGGWYDYGTCSCKTSSSGSTTNTTSGSCPSGSHWMSENGGYCMSDSTPSGSTTSSGGGSSSGSCPSGYHWMSDNGGWCMQDGGGSSSGSTTSTSSTSTPAPAPTSAPTTTTEPAPAPATEPAPAPATEPAPAPSP